MNLYELGRQYMARSSDLVGYIRELNRRLNVSELRGNDRIIIKRRIASLYYDAANCRRLAKTLMNYYKGDGEL